ncbi:hypothetical protein HGRIS_002053 [Hohenbuehelia grisea]|uniref:3-oxo-5-alpha-steroid 4-dehydrogenase C-terminal domain-containing protein n=1 Tax=Hohenbuehelia grisea TaxID=104357 RepID=A0ABR3JJY6_9AGAR
MTISWYDTARKLFLLGNLPGFPVTFFWDAPFGRFTPKNSNSIFVVDGIRAWICMELVSPITFLYTLSKSPAPLPTQAKVLAALFLLHYLNRAIISPLRTPSRSKTHIIVTLSGAYFNILNASLLGTYLASATAAAHLASVSPLTWYAGITLWALGFAGNIFHDEILLNIRRKAQQVSKRDGKGEHYGIPFGFLYKYISYPNYFCEWAEWFGYAMAASPVPTIPSFPTSLAGLFSPVTSANPWWPSMTPPWLFFITEVYLMLPRAYRGHKWYHSKFGASYPPERKAVIPFIL